MAEQMKIYRLAGLEDWRIKAFNFGGPVGHVFSRTFELMHTVIRDGTANEQSVGYAMESLSRERELALSRDEYSNDPVNSLIYGVADNLKFMMDSILEEKRPPIEERPQTSSSSSVHILPQLKAIKEEPLFMPLPPKVDPGNGTACSSKQVQPKVKPQNIQKINDRPSAALLPQKTALEGQSNAAIQQPDKKSIEKAIEVAASTPPAKTATTHNASTLAASAPISAIQTPVIPTAPTTTPAARMVPEPVPVAPAVINFALFGAKSAVVFHMCDECGKSFETNKGLQRHAFIHKALRCNVCRKFINPSKMKAHLAQYHGGRKSSKKGGWDRESDDDEGVYERRPRTPSPTVSTVSAATTVAYRTPAASTPPTIPADANTPE